MIGEDILEELRKTMKNLIGDNQSQVPIHVAQNTKQDCYPGSRVSRGFYRPIDNRTAIVGRIVRNMLGALRLAPFVGVSKSFRTELITKYTLTFGYYSLRRNTKRYCGKTH
jgi:hypothetical protein